MPSSKVNPLQRRATKADIENAGRNTGVAFTGAFAPFIQECGGQLTIEMRQEMEELIARQFERCRRMAQEAGLSRRSVRLYLEAMWLGMRIGLAEAYRPYTGSSDEG